MDPQVREFRVWRTKLESVLLIRPPTIFKDLRGDYVEIYNEELYRRRGVEVKFVQDDFSVSSKHVLRGIHGDDQTWKLVSCLFGKIYLVVVNWDKNTAQFGRWQSFIISDRNRLQVLVPAKFANGHLVLSEKAIFHYKQSAYYDRPRQFTIRWNDPNLRIKWPVRNPILSKRDRGAKDVVLRSRPRRSKVRVNSHAA